MNKKIKIAIICGGKSAEHEVSLQSAKNIIEALDIKKYDPTLIGIDKKGNWHLYDIKKYLVNFHDPQLIQLNNQANQTIALIPQSEGKISNLDTHLSDTSIDVVFPILHGPFGEDGTMQGLLKLANIPFVGASVLGSAVGMDKDVMKRLLREADIPTARCMTVHNYDIPTYHQIVKKLGSPFFIKPANMGSSIGVSKVSKKKDFTTALHDAFTYDTKIVIEEQIVGREIECAVLGNDTPIASVLGEVIPNHDFYSYEAKYLDKNGAILEIPAKISQKTVKKIQTLALRTFQILNCEGMGRIDFFLTIHGEVFVNEINTIPGFTSISMFPMLWKASGISYTELIDRLIQLAYERFDKEQKLKTSFIKQ